ncbi:hypothetical protein ADL12_36370 [Streptomyces regalis]|uniref:Uncharacterized protein n=1 Tax=Streptomyces regalis TaxID=68262 RepID=A0A124G827_9ACTN|nr:hypothetical protein ADL12_36370 [Streptomyces regalis]
MPGTRSMSPKLVKTTPGRAAMAMARSSVSSGVTLTGQPGPWIIRMPAGSSSSMPCRTRVWVWPPQTSMIRQGFVAVRRNSSTSCRAGAGSRYSSRYFTAGHSVADPPAR